MRLSLHSRVSAAHDCLQLVDKSHVGVARHRHCESAVRSTIVHSLHDIARGHHAIDKTGGKAVAATHAIRNLQSVIAKTRQSVAFLEKCVKSASGELK